MGPAINRACSSVRLAQGTTFDRWELANGEVFGETLSSTHTQGYPRLGRQLTGASSLASMADNSGHAVAHQQSLAMAGSGEDGPTSMVT